MKQNSLAALIVLVMMAGCTPSATAPTKMPTKEPTSDTTMTNQATKPEASGKIGNEPEPAAYPGISGTTWSLVEIASMDNSVYRPAEGSRYELSFEPEGVLLVQADCNRGRGTWKETLPASIEFGAIATTRMACPPGSLDTRFLSDLGYTRSFVIRDGHLFLATMADGAILEFQPLPDLHADN